MLKKWKCYRWFEKLEQGLKGQIKSEVKKSDVTVAIKNNLIDISALNKLSAQVRGVLVEIEDSPNRSITSTLIFKNIKEEN